MKNQQLGTRFLYSFIIVTAILHSTDARAEDSPKLFGPGVISGAADDLSPAFAPDGKTVYFTRGNASGSMIVVSRFADDQWSTPQVAPFSGVWNDLEPTMSPDGSFLVFASNRPIVEGGKTIDGHFNGQTFAGQGGNLWRVNRTKDGWGVPQRLPETINHDTSTFSPSICADGSIYFMRPDKDSGRFHLFHSQYRGGRYLEAEAVQIGDATTEDVDPAVAPDESFLVYSSNQPHPPQRVPKRLRIVFRQKESWGTPIDLGDEVNEKGSNIEARLSPDAKTLYFSTNTVPPASFPRSAGQAQRELKEMQVWANGSENIWYVSLTPWLKSAEAR